MQSKNKIGTYLTNKCECSILLTQSCERRCDYAD
nr:MAG TPA: hypothetical protein [Caudoviricetes sp.]